MSIVCSTLLNKFFQLIQLKHTFYGCHGSKIELLQYGFDLPCCRVVAFKDRQLIGRRRQFAYFFAQVAGLKYTVDPAAEVGSRISDVQVMKDGAWAPIDPAAEYGVASNNYMRNGGDGYEVFAANATNVYDFGPDLADVLAEYIVKQGPDFAPATDGRITVVEAAPAEAAPVEGEAAPAAQ